MLISKTFKYDPEQHPKCADWVKRLKADGKNFSEAVRRLIENDRLEREQIQQDLADLRKEIQRLKAGGLPQVEQAQILELGEVVEAIAEQPEVKININALKNRYLD